LIREKKEKQLEYFNESLKNMDINKADKEKIKVVLMVV